MNASHLQNLVRLATESSSDKRRELLEDVTDLFLGADQASEEEGELYSDIFEKVAQQVATEVRSRLAERLAVSDAAPHRVVALLANDVIEVAGPILEQSGKLSDEDLLVIAGKHGQGHLQAISRRARVSTRVADVIVDRGDDTTLATLAGNDGAELSQQAIETLVDRSENSEAIQAPLAVREGVPASLMLKMFTWVTDAVREQILSSTDLSEADVDQALEESRASVRQQAQDDEAQYSHAEKMIRRQARLGQLNQPYLLQQLRQGQFREFMVAFAYFCEMDKATAERIIMDAGHQGLAIACKAHEIDRNTFSSMVLLIDKHLTKKSRTPDEVAEFIALYDKVPIASARRAMRFWKVRQQTQNEEVSAKAATA